MPVLGHRRRTSVVVPGVVVALALVLAGCGSTKTVTGSSAEPAGAPSDASKIIVEDMRLFYSGDGFHTAIVVVRNAGSQTAIDVGGQVSVLDAHGKLVKSTSPTPVTLPPGARGVLLDDVLRLPQRVPDGRLDVRLSVARFGPAPARIAVRFKRLRYSLSGVPGVRCSVTGVVSNTFTRAKENLQLLVVGYAGGKLAFGALTYVDHVFPGTDATFEATPVSIGGCPKRLDRIQVLPNLSEDKLYRP
jgi:hypothetical protein